MANEIKDLVEWYYNTVVNKRNDEYMEAIRENDMKKVQKLVDKMAKETGYTIKKYHVTPAKFTIFRTPSEFTDRVGMRRLKASYPDENVMTVYIKVTNIENLTGSESSCDPDNKPQVKKYAEAKNLDALTVNSNWGDTKDLIVINPNQIKSSKPITFDDNGSIIPLNQRFNRLKMDIRY